MSYSPWGQKIESAQKIHASRGRYEMHGNQILLGVASPVSEILVLYHLPSKQPKISLRTMSYSPWGQKIESAQKIHASRG